MVPVSHGRPGVLLLVALFVGAAVAVAGTASYLRSPDAATKTAGAGAAEGPDGVPGVQLSGESIVAVDTEGALPLPVGWIDPLVFDAEFGCAAQIGFVDTGDLCNGSAETARRFEHTVAAGLTGFTVRFEKSIDGPTGAGFCLRSVLLDVNDTRCFQTEFEESYVWNATDVPAGTLLTLDLWLPPLAQVAYHENVLVRADLTYWGGPAPAPHRVDLAFDGRIACAVLAGPVQSADLCSRARVDDDAKTAFTVPFEAGLTAMAWRVTVGADPTASHLLVYWRIPASVIPDAVCEDTCTMTYTPAASADWTEEAIYGRFAVRVAAAGGPQVAFGTAFTVDLALFYHGEPMPAEELLFA